MKLLMEFYEIVHQQHSYYIYNVIMMSQWILFCLFIITFSFSLKINTSILFLLQSSNFNNKCMLARTPLLTAVEILNLSRDRISSKNGSNP